MCSRSADQPNDTYSLVDDLEEGDVVFRVEVRGGAGVEETVVGVVGTWVAAGFGDLITEGGSKLFGASEYDGSFDAATQVFAGLR